MSLEFSLKFIRLLRVVFSSEGVITTRSNRMKFRLPWIHTRHWREAVRKFLPAQFPWCWCKCLLRNFVHWKIYNLTKYREVRVKYFTAHYACRNADLNLTLVMGTTNRFKLNQFIIEFWGYAWPALTVSKVSKEVLKRKKQSKRPRRINGLV